MTYVYKFLWVLGFAALLYGINWCAKKGYFDKVKSSVDGTPYKFDMLNWKRFFPVVAIVVLLTVALVACSSGDAPTPPATASSALCPSTIQGTVDAPPIADRVSALAIEAQSKGIALTGDYAQDVRNQGGEMMLIGTQFKFVFDAGCQIDKSQSSLNLFLTDYPVEGGMEANGTLGMAVDVGGAKVGIKGRVVNGQFVEGEVRKGWLPHIYGVLTGSYKKP
jgi:hypothetical protein